MDDRLEEYILRNIEGEPDNLKRLNRRVHTQLLYSRMCSGHLQGRLLKMLTRMINPLRVLEIGTYAGYSALCIAEGLLRDGATVDTIEIEDELEDFIHDGFADSPYGDRIRLHIGDALQIVPTLGGGWDMVFIDANKRHYTDYYNAVIEQVVPGGFVIADNTLWDGKVTHPESHNDAQTRGILDFNELVAHDPRVETVIIPLRDGLTIIRKEL